METINGHYRKIDNLDDAFKAVAERFSERVGEDSALLGAYDEVEIGDRKYRVEVKEIKDADS
jgi:hypothetical protein